jgi:glycerol-3-phosphate acyltransferase PlsY
MDTFFAILIGYLLGSIPFAFLLSRRHGIDLRHVGSGNVGASNVLRTTGVRTAVLAMCLDGAKGALAVLVAERIAAGATPPVAAGVAAIVGHIYPLWLGWRGGKGVATSAGMFAVLAPVPFAIAGAVFIVGVSATRYVSVGSMAGVVTLAIATAASDAPAPVVAGAMLTALLVIYGHRGNVSRLVAGTERHLGIRDS